MQSRHVKIPASLAALVEAEAARTGHRFDRVVTDALAAHFQLDIHTVFQVSTSGALVAGVYDREVSVATLLEHGDFGLGTFTGLDGEMIIIDGSAYHADGWGHVTPSSPDAGAPFAIVTRFTPEHAADLSSIGSFADLEAKCDPYRESGNIFYAIRLDGHFAHIKARAIDPPPPGMKLAEAAKTQHEFAFDDIEGTLVGIWSPDFSGPFSVAGYHFHFISADRLHGGHLLDVAAESLRMTIEPLSNFHLALPETEAFLKAKIGRDTETVLAAAEHSQ